MAENGETGPGIREKLDLVPTAPGVYLMKDEAGEVIYVGKAKSLRNRIRTYFRSPRDRAPKERVLVGRTADFDYVVTDSEVEALILEANLIKRHRPRYNVRLKDDKSYPYLKLTLNEDYPRIFVTRLVKNDGARYFGPYADVGAVRRTLKLIGSLFPLRTCSREIESGDDGGERACLNHHIDKCMAPCTGRISSEEYMGAVKNVILFLEGRDTELLDDLEARMQRAAEEERFEAAARLRDSINAVRKVTSRQKVAEANRREDRDVLALAEEEDLAAVQVFRIRSGRMVGREEFVLEGARDTSFDEALAAFIQQFYINSPMIPPEILLPIRLPKQDLLSRWLSEKRGGGVSLHVPQRGHKRRLVEMAIRNSDLALERLRVERRQHREGAEEALSELAGTLGLPDKPRRIEGIDISTIRGRDPVGSLVVFEEGLPRKEDYRCYRIRDVDRQDDFAMIGEVVGRRYSRHMTEDQPMPDLILIDGGRGQLGAAVEVLENLGFTDQPVVGLAKEFEEVYLPGVSEPVDIDRDSPGGYLLQRVRDEAHRFAVSYHRRLRSRRLTHSVLDEIPGVGPKRRQALLNHFGSLDKIRKATQSELKRVPGISRKTAEAIHSFMREQMTAF